MDLSGLGWDDGILDLFGIPRACLPAIVPSSAVETMGLGGTLATSVLGRER